MKIQVLVATMNQNDHSLINKMNIKSEAIVGNQCEKNSVCSFYIEDKKIIYLNFKEKGVGLNRNNSLMRAEADICLFADDDMKYVDDYVDIVKKAFLQIPKADIIIFNLKEKNPTRYVIKKVSRIRWFNYLRYGTARIAIRLQAVRINGVYFNQCFGGGTDHCHGEDNLFLTDCLKAGLRIFSYPEYIAELTEDRPSTWNNMYDIKYLKDQGILYKQVSRVWWRLLCVQDAFRHFKTYKVNPIKAYLIMTKQ